MTDPVPGQAANAPEQIDMLESLRRVEKEQALFYRALAAEAEQSDSALAQRFHDLHADEQHHLSRLTARVLELGGRPLDLASVTTEPANLADWKSAVVAREATEIALYRELLALAADPVTRELLQEIHAVEEHHAAELGGKWTMA